MCISFHTLSVESIYIICEWKFNFFALWISSEGERERESERASDNEDERECRVRVCVWGKRAINHPAKYNSVAHGLRCAVSEWTSLIKFMIGYVDDVLRYSLEVVDFVVAVAVDRSRFFLCCPCLAFFLEIRRVEYCVRRRIKIVCQRPKYNQEKTRIGNENGNQNENDIMQFMFGTKVCGTWNLLLLLHFQLNLNKVNELQSNVLLNILDYTLRPDSTLS